MSKRSIPILIGLMSAALVGIIIVQFNWIRDAVGEKQLLIDKNVMLAVANVEQQLNDDRAISFMNDSLIEKITAQIHPDQTDSEYIQTNRFTNNSGELQVEVITNRTVNKTNDTSLLEVVEGFDFSHRRINSDSSNISVVQFTEDNMQLGSLIDRMQIEILSSGGDIRLDSTHISHVLSNEFQSSGLTEIIDWGLFDTKENEEIVRRNTKVVADYQIPLFTTDIFLPGRYHLQLVLSKSTLIWKGVWVMILLSLLFISIISVVFAYSIKLIIRHKKISQIKSDFINNMTHEFKTPLASISLAADSLLHANMEVNPNSLKKYLGIIKNEKDKLNQQVERILEVASLKKEKVDIPLNSVNIAQIVSKTLANMSLQIELSKADIQIDLDENCEAQANAFHLQNVLSNLIENSIKYSAEQPQISIALVQRNSEILLTVSDSGIGMTKHQVKHAFDDFFRAQTGDLHATRGFGLGLTYCKMVIEKMGASIKLESDEETGTRVFINLIAL